MRRTLGPANFTLSRPRQFVRMGGAPGFVQDLAWNHRFGRLDPFPPHGINLSFHYSISRIGNARCCPAWTQSSSRNVVPDDGRRLQRRRAARAFLPRLDDHSASGSHNLSFHSACANGAVCPALEFFLCSSFLGFTHRVLPLSLELTQRLPDWLSTFLLMCCRRLFCRSLPERVQLPRDPTGEILDRAFFWATCCRSGCSHPDVPISVISDCALFSRPLPERERPRLRAALPVWL